MFERVGARRSLQYSTIVYALTVGSTGAVMQWSSRRLVVANDGDIFSLKIISQCWIVFMFVAKSAFVQLLYSQHWSFLTSLLSCNDEDCSHAQTARWAPIIAGIASIAATASGWLVAPLVEWIKLQYSKVPERAVNTDDTLDDLTGLLFVSAILLLVTCCFSDLAYVLADGQFAQTIERKIERKHAEKRIRTESLLQESVRLLRRTPILIALCAEVIVYQSVASFYNQLFVSSTKSAISVDHARAVYTGKV